MGRSIKGVIVVAVVVAIAGLAILASGAFAYSGSSSNSCYGHGNRRGWGISTANNQPAGYYANGLPVYHWANQVLPCSYH